MTTATLAARKPSYTLRIYESLSAGFAKAARVEKTRRALSALSDETLRDIGLSRDEIDAAALRAAR
ncbi:DUF1127 domain-containing protein [Mangrovicoccus sp. HB161399]|uniref:DUF1127 domain-containing protein n=1 Tax=Mangrovicoccus sp. HB161399 TaxID=2720392 RepID=UPI0020A6CF4C|nr:DUF1127 domain-containing protein [Mangrovicoccus sp. HB161399]